MKHCYFLVLSGGSGERLWPLSRQDKPKQFIPFIKGKSMLELTVERLTQVAFSKEQLGVVTTERYVSLTSQTVGNVFGFTIIEPEPRNTAAAVLLSCLRLQQKDPSAIVVVCPADAYIDNSQKFADEISRVVSFVKKQPVVGILGIKPIEPATGYGYIIADIHTTYFEDCFFVERFHEKPSLKEAGSYCEQKDVYWNIGMYVAQVSVLIEEFKLHARQLYEAVVAYEQGLGLYNAIPSISLDYAVAEKSKNLMVFPVAFGWSDVGNLYTFLSLMQPEGQRTKIATTGGANNTAYAKEKSVFFVGVSDLCLIETNDVTLVVKKEEVEQVRALVKEIKKQPQTSLC